MAKSKTDSSSYDANNVGRRLTDAELIEAEKKKFVWIKPFYWNNKEDLSADNPYLDENGELGFVENDPFKQRITPWIRPFLWTNSQSRAIVASKTTSGTRVAAGSKKFSQPPTNQHLLISLPPIEWTEPPLGPSPRKSMGSDPRMVAYHPRGLPDEQFPTPAEQTGATDEPLPLPSSEEPIEGILEGNLPPMEGMPGVPSLDDADGEGDGVIADAETLGSEPEDNSLQFLRADTVLLEPGQMQFDYGVTYSLFDQTLPAINGSNQLELARFRQRELLVPLELRYGFTRRIQLFVNVPFGWSNIEFALSDADLFENDGGIGDIVFGGTALLRQGQGKTSDVVLTVAASAPSGQDPFVIPVGQPGVPSLGNGTWSIATNLLFIRTYDPIVVFYGVGTRQHLLRDLNGQNFRAGQEYNYQMGVGFAVNEKVTFSTRFSGSYVTEARLGGQRLLGSIREPMVIELAMTIAQSKGLLVEPFIDFGLTDDALQARFGVVWTRY